MKVIVPARYLTAIRALFRKGDQGRQPINVNEIIVEVMESLRGELKDHDVETRPELRPNCRSSTATGVNCERSSLTWSTMRSKQWTP